MYGACYPIMALSVLANKKKKKIKYLVGKCIYVLRRGMGRKVPYPYYYDSFIYHDIEERAQMLKPVALVHILTLPFSRCMNFRQVTKFLCALIPSRVKRELKITPRL